MALSFFCYYFLYFYVDWEENVFIVFSGSDKIICFMSQHMKRTSSVEIVLLTNDFPFLDLPFVC